MQKKIFFLIAAVIAALSLSACKMEIKPAEPNGNFSTQTRMTAIEYSIYMNKQITIFANAIMTRMQAVHNMNGTMYSREAELAEAAKKTLQEARDEVETTYPASGKDDDRETVLQTMDTALNDFGTYIQALKEQKDVSDYADIFENDFNELTGLATLYTQ